MELDTKLYLVDENGEKFMGIGVLWLLEEVGKGQSLRSASKSMNLSYYKAYNMIVKLEKTVGRAFVERKRGGINREGVVLTDFARSYMELYKEFQSKAKAAAKKEYEEYKQKLSHLMEDTSCEQASI